MIEYIYKGFKISYHIATADSATNIFKADGSVSYLLNMPKSFRPTKFHTEHSTQTGAEHEIKKLLENYVDFELKNYYDMQKEKVTR